MIVKGVGEDTSVATYTATDPEGSDITGWSIAGADASHFQIANGVLSLSEAPAFDAGDANGDNIYEVEVRAEVGSSRGALSVIVVVEQRNQPPKFTAGLTVVSYAENRTNNVSVYTATDADGETVVLSLSGTDAGDFSLSGTGALTFAETPNFESPADSNGDNVYNVTVTATSGGQSVSRDVTVTVTNVNEPPVFSSGPSGNVNHPENDTSSLGTYSATDPESQTVSFSLLGSTPGCSVSTQADP